MADYSAPKRSKFVKKTDRGSRLTDRSQLNIGIGDINEEKLSNEPYQCTGRLFDDFLNLCKQNQISYIPPIIHRGKRPSTPNLADVKIEKTKGKKGTVSNITNESFSQSEQLLPVQISNHKQHSISTLNEQDENKDLEAENLPKTFVLIKDRTEYFKPKIQVEVETYEKAETVTELYIRGWKIEPQIMNILEQSLPFSERLTTMNLWYCGLNEETFDILANFLPKCPNLKNLNLDGNALVDENFSKLIKSDSLIQHLSLRYCQITDKGAEKLSKELGTIRQQNTKLLSLNLSGNLISDIGSIEIARSLRTNRTLLVLNLSGNNIGDLGACKLAETLSKFKMSHEEIVRRRTIKRERIVRDLSPESRKMNKSAFIERPSSISSNLKSTTTSTKNKLNKTESASLRDRSKSKDVQSGKESIIDKTAGGKSKKDKDSKESVSLSSTQKKEKSKETIGNNSTIQADKTLNKNLKAKPSKKTRDSDNENDSVQRSVSKLSNNAQPLLSFENDPLMDEVEGIEGELLLIGNRTLISLNLSRNKISIVAVKEFLLCIQMQTTMSLFNKTNSSNGLLKLNLNKNDFSPTNEYFVKLNDLMKTRDPIANKAAESLVDKDTNSVISKDGRETNRSKSSRMKF